MRDLAEVDSLIHLRSSGFFCSVEESPPRAIKILLAIRNEFRLIG